MTDELCRRYPNEDTGDLSMRHAALTSGMACGRIGMSAGIARFLKIKPEPGPKLEDTPIIGNSMEAVR